MTACILYGLLTYHDFWGGTVISVVQPIATKTCIECEHEKELNVSRLKKNEKNLKDIQLLCHEVEITK